MRPWRLALVAFLVVIAAFAALLAADLHAWPGALRNGDARYRVSPASASWPVGIAAAVLGTGDDVAARRAIRRFRLTYGVPGTLATALQRQGARAQAELALAQVARSRDAVRAAQASDLLGILAFGDMSAGGGADPSQAERAVSAFVNAVRLNPGDAAAKDNLELVLRLFQAHGVRPGATPGAGVRGRGSRGAGTGIPGRGY